MGCTPCLWAGKQGLTATSPRRARLPQGRGGVAGREARLFRSFLLTGVFCPQVPRAVRLIIQINQRRPGASVTFLTLSGKPFFATDAHSPFSCGQGGSGAWSFMSSLLAVPGISSKTVGRVTQMTGCCDTLVNADHYCAWHHVKPFPDMRPVKGGAWPTGQQVLSPGLQAGRSVMSSARAGSPSLHPGLPRAPIRL